MPTPDPPRSPDDLWAEVVLACKHSGESDDAAIRSANTIALDYEQRRGESVDTATGAFPIVAAKISRDGVKEYPVDDGSSESAVTIDRENSDPAVLESLGFDIHPDRVISRLAALRTNPTPWRVEHVEDMGVLVLANNGQEASHCFAYTSETLAFVAAVNAACARVEASDAEHVALALGTDDAQPSDAAPLLPDSPGTWAAYRKDGGSLEECFEVSIAFLGSWLHAYTRAHGAEPLQSWVWVTRLSGFEERSGVNGELVPSPGGLTPSPGSVDALRVTLEVLQREHELLGEAYRERRRARERDADVYLRALAKAYRAADPGCPANEDGSGEWAIDDVAEAVTRAIGERTTSPARKYSPADCEIIEKYMPPYPQPDTKPTLVVRHKPSDTFLRYSKGPRQGHFWDVYGEHYQTRELAEVAIAWVCKYGCSIAPGYEERVRDSCRASDTPRPDVWRMCDVATPKPPTAPRCGVPVRRPAVVDEIVTSCSYTPDPEDDAAWPLPPGHRWARDTIGSKQGTIMVAADDGDKLWVEDNHVWCSADNFDERAVFALVDRWRARHVERPDGPSPKALREHLARTGVEIRLLSEKLALEKFRKDEADAWCRRYDERTHEAAGALGLPALDWPAVINAIGTLRANLDDSRERVRVAEADVGVADGGAIRATTIAPGSACGDGARLFDVDKIRAVTSIDGLGTDEAEAIAAATPDPDNDDDWPLPDGCEWGHGTALEEVTNPGQGWSVYVGRTGHLSMSTANNLAAAEAVAVLLDRWRARQAAQGAGA